jgi:hypothetical protein
VDEGDRLFVGGNETVNHFKILGVEHKRSLRGCRQGRCAPVITYQDPWGAGPLERSCVPKRPLVAPANPVPRLDAARLNRVMNKEYSELLPNQRHRSTPPGVEFIHPPLPLVPGHRACERAAAKG